MIRALPDEVVETLEPWVDRGLLERTRVSTGARWEWLPLALGTGAVTLGRHVFFRSERYDIATARGMALIGHESQHVGQYAELGIPRLLFAYARGQFSAGFSHDDHPMERDLVARQQEIRQALRDQGLPDR